METPNSFHKKEKNYIYKFKMLNKIYRAKPGSNLQRLGGSRRCNLWPTYSLEEGKKYICIRNMII